MSITGGLLLIVAAAHSPWIDPAPKGRWAGTTSELAAFLLPPDMAADVVSHQVQRPIFEGGPPYMVKFAGRPRPAGHGFCERFEYAVYIRGRDEGQEERDPPRRGTEIRMGECPVGKEAIFARFNRDDAVGAKQAFRWVEWARRQAQSSRPLSFQIACRDETEQLRCADGGRKALAELPLDKTWMLSRKDGAPAHHWELWVTETQPGQKLWVVGIDATPGKSAIDLVWKIPAPF